MKLKYYAYIVSTLSDDYFPVGAFLLPEVNATSKIMLLGDSLLILNSNHNNVLDIIGKILVYKIEASE